jgi:hypothetical protein
VERRRLQSALLSARGVQKSSTSSLRSPSTRWTLWCNTTHAPSPTHLPFGDQQCKTGPGGLQRDQRRTAFGGAPDAPVFIRAIYVLDPVVRLRTTSPSRRKHGCDPSHGTGTTVEAADHVHTEQIPGRRQTRRNGDTESAYTPAYTDPPLSPPGCRTDIESLEWTPSRYTSRPAPLSNAVRHVSCWTVLRIAMAVSS